MKKTIAFVIAAVTLLTVAVAAAADSGYTMTYLPGTTDTVTDLPEADPGVGGSAYTVSSTIPQREGYEFIDWTLDYEVLTYKVTYVVNPDPTYGSPEGSTVPTDPTRYPPKETVDVAAQLTTKVDYAYNEKGEKVKGTWEFVTWDKDDFEITADTTITGGWRFTPAPAIKYHYTVEYWFVDGSKLVAKVADDKPGTVDALGDKVTEEAIPMGSKFLKVKYRSPLKYRIKPHWESVTATINKNNQVIYIFYELIPHGQ